MTRWGGWLHSAGMNLLTSGLSAQGEPEAPEEVAARYQLVMVNLLGLVGSTLLVAFGVVDTARGEQPLGALATAVGAFGYGCFLIVRRTRNERFFSRLFVPVVALLFLYLLATGGSGDTGFFWFFTFPPVALFLLGLGAGSLATVGTLGAAALLLYLPGHSLLGTAYSLDFHLRFLPAVAAVWAFTAVFAFVRAVTQRRLVAQNQALASALTALRAAQQALASEREHLAVTLRSVADGVIATGTDARVGLMNRAAEDLTGWSQEEARGRPLAEVCRTTSPPGSSEADDLVAAALADGTVASGATPRTLVAKSGAKRLVLASTAPIRHREAEVRGAVLVLRDVTGQAALEEELLRARKLESLGVLAGGIAHDFNNLLAGMVGAAELGAAALEHGEGQKARRHLDQIAQAGERATALTRQLLTFSTGGAPVRETVDVAALVGESVDFTLAGSPVRAELALGAELRPVDADPGQLSQVLTNLLLNAAQATPGGGKVRVAAENAASAPEGEAPLPEGPWVRIVVEDAGMGIAEQDLARIFDPYFSTKPGGSGLGLATAHAIVRKHGGHLRVRSAPGRGSTFTVYLPARAAPAPVREPPDPASGTAARSARILVVEDEETVRAVLVESLAQLGHRVESAEDGAAGLCLFDAALARGDEFDLVITDLTIPGGMGGRELAEKLRERDPAARVIASSGYSAEPVLADPARYGFAGALPKPWRRSDLRKAVERALARGSDREVG